MQFYIASLLSICCYCRYLSVLRYVPGVAQRRRPKLSPSNLWALKTHSRLPSTLSVSVSARLKGNPTAPCVTKATAPTSVVSACAILDVWVRGVSAPRVITAWVNRTHVAALTRWSAAGVGTVCVVSVCVTTMTLERSGGRGATVMTSAACDIKGSCAQVRVFHNNIRLLLNVCRM